MEDALDLAASVMLVLSREIPAGTIKPLDYWPRLKSALESAAHGAEDYPGFISDACRRLGIEVLSRHGGEGVYQLQPKDFEAMRDAFVRRATYIVILAQVQRAEERGEGKLLTATELVEAITREDEG